MLETVGPFLAAAFRKDDAGRAQPRQRGFELSVALKCNRFEQSKRELPANDRSDLRHLACLAEAVEPRHERVAGTAASEGPRAVWRNSVCIQREHAQSALHAPRVALGRKNVGDAQFRKNGSNSRLTAKCFGPRAQYLIV